MIQIVKKVSAALLLTATLASCEKKLTDIQPIDLIPSQVAILTISDVNSALNGVYGTWSPRRSVYISAFISDEIKLGVGSEYRNIGNTLFNWDHVSDSQDWRDAELGGTFTNLYQVIDRVNRTLELMAPIVPANATDTALKTRYRGELLALRGMAHLELLRSYAETAEYTPAKLGVIIQKEYVKNPIGYSPARSTQAETVAAITADLTEAKTLIPASFTNISRVTRNAVIATQARVALLSKNWQEAVDRASDVITAQPITTSTTAYAALWTTRVLPENQSSEIIWKLNATTANIGFVIGTLFQDAGTGAQQAAPAVKLINTFDQANDIRFSTFFKTTPRNLIAKYGFLVTGNGETFQYDTKMIRTSEILLARAEANAELGQTTLANTDLSALRTARIAGYKHTAITDKAALIDTLLLERYKELCYEGQRYFDLKRRSLPIVRNLTDVAGNTAIQTLQPSNPKYILPIPQQEKFANPNVQQNPGY